MNTYKTQCIPSEILYLRHDKPIANQHRRAARIRWNVQRALDLQMAKSLFETVDGGMFKAFVDRLQTSVLRAHEPLPLESLALAVRILGNARVDRFKTLERRCGLARTISLYLKTLTRAEVKGLRAGLARHFAASRHAVKHYVGTKKTNCRRLFIDLTPMRSGELGLTDDFSDDPRRRLAGPVTRITMMSGDNRVAHACLRTRVSQRTAVRTEADAFACAKRCAEAHHPEGLFVCEPSRSNQTGEVPAPALTLKPVDLIETLAWMIVHACKAYRRGNRVVVSLSDFTGAVDPLQLKQAILRLPLQTEVSFVYLPCGARFNGWT